MQLCLRKRARLSPGIGEYEVRGYRTLESRFGVSTRLRALTG
jgi:hypothetical protein